MNHFEKLNKAYTKKNFMQKMLGFLSIICLFWRYA